MMQRCDLRAIALWIVGIAISAHAQPADDPGKAAYEEGRRLYDQKRWTAAIAKFEESYRLRHDAPSLFNIAQAYRLTGDCAHAIVSYRKYKEEFPSAPNLDKVEKFITELEPCAQQQAPVEPPKPTEPPKPPTPNEPPKPPPEPPKPAPV